MAIREVIFRGKRKDNGEWIENHTVVELRDGQKYIPNNSAPSGLKINENGNIVSFVALFHEVLPSTVGQYTGFTDKNGRKIFEGDIVIYGDTIHEVVFEKRNTTAYFGLVYSEIETMPFGHYQDLNHIEVIGNIHDNPESLEGDAK